MSLRAGPEPFHCDKALLSSVCLLPSFLLLKDALKDGSLVTLAGLPGMGWRGWDGILREDDFHHKPRVLLPAAATVLVAQHHTPDVPRCRWLAAPHQCPLQQGCDEFVTYNFLIAAEEAETLRGATKVHFKFIHPQREEGILEENNLNEQKNPDEQHPSFYDFPTPLLFLHWLRRRGLSGAYGVCPWRWGKGRKLRYKYIISCLMWGT